jgi:hypothetical protein
MEQDEASAIRSTFTPVFAVTPDRGEIMRRFA